MVFRWSGFQPPSLAVLGWWKWHFDVSPRPKLDDCLRDIANVLSYEPPIGRHQYQDRKLAFRKILLIAKVLVCCDDYLESGCFGGFQQVAIFEQAPTSLKSGLDFVTG